jgi:metal-sulfur cluster biosynthetic enzyme
MTLIPTLPTPEQVRHALRTVVDPEVGINIIDLGLVYAVRVSAEMIDINLTMTSPACPMSDLLFVVAEQRLFAADSAP